ncbi:hypothetical protein SETIT_4G255500v2 [Setaria italica]|uniref:Uncharacterized protein n=1 Tax=Setaria italica TaxID=4555 RepID=A0A368QY62_SETIT|nr:hypothetical protein SETIT_4G255500v2 [Setaria italica]
MQRKRRAWCAGRCITFAWTTTTLLLKPDIAMSCSPLRLRELGDLLSAGRPLGSYCWHLLWFGDSTAVPSNQMPGFLSPLLSAFPPPWFPSLEGR